MPLVCYWGLPWLKVSNLQGVMACRSACVLAQQTVGSQADYTSVYRILQHSVANPCVSTTYSDKFISFY